MSIDALTIPATYARLILDLCNRRGLDLADEVVHFDAQALNDPDGRLQLTQVAMLFYEAFRQDDAIGYEIGLNTQFSSHGAVGYGILTYPTFGEALAFGLRFARLRTPFVEISREVADGTVILDVAPAFDLGPMTRICLEHFLIGIWSVAKSVAQASGIAELTGALYFQHPEPDCHRSYAGRLPRCVFSAPGYQMRLPADLLDTPLATADATAARLATAQCEEEARRQRIQRTVTAQVSNILAKNPVPPTLDSVASQLHMSTRSLKRKLRAEHSGYQNLVDRHRERLARQWLTDTQLAVGDIAEKLGYTTTANFTRAFRRWTGVNPSEWRARFRQKP